MQVGGRVLKYIPDAWAKVKSKRDREFIWTILATLQPNFVRALISTATSLRQTEATDPNLQEKITIVSEVVQMFGNINYISSKFTTRLTCLCRTSCSHTKYTKKAQSA